MSFTLALNEAADLTITDLVGRVVYTTKLMGKGVTHQELVSLRNQPAGTYIVRIAGQKRTLSGKIVLTH